MPRGDIRLDIAPPAKGLRTDIARHLVPEGYFVDGENVVARDGVLKIRPGFVELEGDTGFVAKPLALFSYSDNNGVRRVFAANGNRIREWDLGTTWTDRTGSTTLTAGPTHQPRMGALSESNLQHRHLHQ
jgi:hypothetical protein